jgi:hypothetical protein
MIIVADASPLISFAILNKLDVLDKLFKDILIPIAVYKEITKVNKKYSNKLKSFAENKTKKVKNKLAVELLQKDLDLGESEAIVLAKENNISDILMDEYKGRKIAKDNGLHPIGTLGVLIQAKKKKLIKKVKPEIDTLIENHIRISDDLYSTALKLAGEE